MLLVRAICFNCQTKIEKVKSYPWVEQWEEQRHQVQNI